MRSTLERSREVAIWSAFCHTSHRLFQRAKPAWAGVALISTAAAALGVPQQAWANNVTVTIIGTTSGYDTTGVFGPKESDLTGDFTLIYIFDDTHGEACRETISCIENSPTYGDPMTKIMLAIGGKSFLFSNSEFSASVINQEASRHLNYGGHAAWLDFQESENSYSSPYSGSSSIKASLLVNSVWAQMHWTQEIPCWEGALPLYTLYPGDSQPSPFGINVFENNKAIYKAIGALHIQSITIQPAQKPSNQCFVGESPR